MTNLQTAPIPLLFTATKVPEPPVFGNCDYLSPLKLGATTTVLPSGGKCGHNKNNRLVRWGKGWRERHMQVGAFLGGDNRKVLHAWVLASKYH